MFSWRWLLFSKVFRGTTSSAPLPTASTTIILAPYKEILPGYARDVPDGSMNHWIGSRAWSKKTRTAGGQQQMSSELFLVLNSTAFQSIVVTIGQSLPPWMMWSFRTTRTTQYVIETLFPSHNCNYVADLPKEEQFAWIYDQFCTHVRVVMLEGPQYSSNWISSAVLDQYQMEAWDTEDSGTVRVHGTTVHSNRRTRIEWRKMKGPTREEEFFVSQLPPSLDMIVATGPGDSVG